jgi:hypothetical protein
MKVAKAVPLAARHFRNDCTVTILMHALVCKALCSEAPGTRAMSGQRL